MHITKCFGQVSLYFRDTVILRTAFRTQVAYCTTYANISNVVYMIFVLFDNKIQAPIDVHFKEKMCQKLLLKAGTSDAEFF